MAWECFGQGNGAATFQEMEARLNEIRQRNNFQQAGPIPQIGCILLANAVFFPRELWIPQPANWSSRNLTYQRYDLGSGEGLRIWRQCQERLLVLRDQAREFPISVVHEALVDSSEERFGPPRLVRPRLGQGTFRVAVTDAYGRACAITAEHSLPVLEAAHIKPFALDGPHDTTNGVLLRADLHRLFDQGYVTITPERRVEVSQRLRVDYENGRSYYPLHGQQIAVPRAQIDRPGDAFLSWHNEHVYRG
jgi:putative restriction endonuclease